MNSMGMPKRAVNLGITSLRITGSGEPATMTLPSFFAASTIAAHSLSLALVCARAASFLRNDEYKHEHEYSFHLNCPPHGSRCIFILIAARKLQTEFPADQHHRADDHRDQQPERRGPFQLAGKAVFEKQNRQRPRFVAVE